MSSTECPTCGRDDFATTHAMRTHHAQAHNFSLGTVEVECSNCGAELTRRQDHARKFDNHFCDNECESEHRKKHRSGDGNPSWQGGPITVSCAECRMEITRRRSKTKTHSRHFCSQNCLAEFRTIALENSSRFSEIHCSNCGSKFEKLNSQINRTKNNYCSRDCVAEHFSERYKGENGPNWKGGMERSYGPDWPQIRKRALERDGYACTVCGMDESNHVDEFGQGLHVHHKTPLRTFDDISEANNLTNLQTVCNICHGRIEPR